jgi:hypothetical protein
MNPLRWRLMTWVIVVFTVLMAVLIGANAGSRPACPPDIALIASCETYQAAAAIGTGLALTALLGVWFVGFMILAIIWIMTRPARRVCPWCGYEARTGQTVCTTCGYDFSAPSHAVQASLYPEGAVQDWLDHRRGREDEL